MHYCHVGGQLNADIYNTVVHSKYQEQIYMEHILHPIYSFLATTYSERKKTKQSYLLK